MSVSTRRRGYIRPQGAEFAESAKSRESVMSLGSIAHLQYYFARTGLLDGRGGTTREWRKKKKPEDEPRLLLTPNERFIPEFTESPTAEEMPDIDDEFDENDEVMLPPTVSTYSIKTHYIPPPPDLRALRKDLLDAVDKAENSIKSMESNRQPPPPESRPPRISVSQDDVPETENGPSHCRSRAGTNVQAWDELQGMHILDVVTLAIRAAKIYYTSHEYPERLSSLKNERELRQELINVLEVLKRWASRNFAGGLRDDERAFFLDWMSGVRAMMASETELEELEAKERESWVWAHGDWTGREREREESFLRSLMGSDAPLPAWSPIEDGKQLPTPMLEHLRDGRDLVRMHNRAVRKSKRRFCEIKSFHQDVGKPYRCAENLQYWLKAAEIRWEVKLHVEVMDVVHGSSDEAWRQFDASLLAWCKAVREELVRDWWGTKTTASDDHPPTEVPVADAV